MTNSASSDPVRIVACPTCSKSVPFRADNLFRPFCSERCRLIDLGEWAAEGHRIAGEPIQPPDSESQ